MRWRQEEEKEAEVASQKAHEQACYLSTDDFSNTPDEFAQGLLRFHNELGSHPHRITMDDWNILTEDKYLCDYQVCGSMVSLPPCLRC